MKRSETKRERRERIAAGDYSGLSARERIINIVYNMPVGTEFRGDDLNKRLPTSYQRTGPQMGCLMHGIPFVAQTGTLRYIRVEEVTETDGSRK